MKRFIAFILSIIMIFTFVPCNVYAGTAGSLSPLHVDGTVIKDSKGNIVILRGVSTHGLSWYPEYVNNKLFGELHDKWNANVVRLALYTEEYNGYCSGDAANRTALKKLIKNGVKYATDNGLYVIIDWHILSDGNPNKNKKSAASFFKWASKSFADNTNVIYEICNEPNSGTTWKQIKSYANYIIPKIRANDKDAIILVGTPTWSQELDKAVASPITGYDNIMYTLHFYAATHKDSLRKVLVDAVNAGLPVFVSEFGICSASGDGGLDKTEGSKWIKTLKKYNISFVAWNLSNKNESSSLIKASVNKKSGFTKSNLTESGKWLLNQLK